MKISDERARELRKWALYDASEYIVPKADVRDLLDDREELLRKLGAHAAFTRLLRDALRALEEA